MKEPWFWRDEGLAARLATAAMTPAAILYDLGQRLRTAAASPQHVGAPVICIGNATLGGVGKTPLALMLQSMLKEHRVSACFVSRGYGGSLKGPLRVMPHHAAEDVGDEPLMLAAAAPTWIASNRAAGVRAASGDGDVVIMDDGFQNPTVRKDLSILMIDSDNPPRNARIFPAGPMREPLTRAISRAGMIVVVGSGDPPLDPIGRPVFRATSSIDLAIAPQRVLAFCGIANPHRFFKSLEAMGFQLTASIAFPDHHFFRDVELKDLRRKAEAAGAALITTEKDYVRLAADARGGIDVAKLKMSIDNAERFSSTVLAAVGRAP